MLLKIGHFTSAHRSGWYTSTVTCPLRTYARSAAAAFAWRSARRTARGYSAWSVWPASGRPTPCPTPKEAIDAVTTAAVPSGVASWWHRTVFPGVRHAASPAPPWVDPCDRAGGAYPGFHSYQPKGTYGKTCSPHLGKSQPAYQSPQTRNQDEKRQRRQHRLHCHCNCRFSLGDPVGGTGAA